MEEKKPIIPIYTFSDPMTRGERIAALVYLPLHFALIPILLSLLVTVWPEAGLSEISLNIFYYALGVVYMFVFLWKYFRRGYDALLDRLGRAIIILIVAYMLYTILLYAVQLITLALGIDMTSTPNNDEIVSMAEYGYHMMFAMAVFMAPLVEEPLFRGLIFGGLHKKNRIMAYAVSAILFSLYHVWQYVVVYADPTYLVYALSYIPASIALAYCYEKSGSIWLSIGFHMMYNGAAMYLSQYV